VAEVSFVRNLVGGSTLPFADAAPKGTHLRHIPKAENQSFGFKTSTAAAFAAKKGNEATQILPQA
jgi:hypothetical protein